MSKTHCPSCDEPIRFYPMEKQVECPGCGEMVKRPDVRGKTKRQRAEPRQASPEWKRGLWIKAIGCVILSTIVLLLCYFAFPTSGVPLTVLWCLIQLKLIIYMVVCTRRQETGRPGFDEGLSELALLFKYAFLRPQMLIVLLCVVATGIVGERIEANAFEEQEQQSEAIAKQGSENRKDDNQTDNNQPNKQPPKWIAPKTPPPATEFPDLVGYWSFDEADGLPVDSSPSKMQGRLHGTTRIKGIRGKAIQFDGTPNNYLDLGIGASLNFAKNEAFTIAGWAKTTDRDGMIFGCRYTIRPHSPLIRIFLRGGVLVGWVRNDLEISAPVPGEGSSKFADGKWRHFALTRQPDGELDLYLDGKSIGGMRGNQFVKPGNAITTNQRILGGSPVWLSNRQGNPGGHFYEGAVDEFCVFKRALTPAEIRQLAGR